MEQLQPELLLDMTSKELNELHKLDKMSVLVALSIH
jgi:hypothetical protein